MNRRRPIPRSSYSYLPRPKGPSLRYTLPFPQTVLTASTLTEGRCAKILLQATASTSADWMPC